MKSIAVLAAIVGMAVAQGEPSGSQEGSASSGSSSSGANSAAASAAATAAALEVEMNSLLALSFLYSLAAVVGAIFAYRVTIYAIAYIRMLSCLTNDHQRYFAIPNLGWAKVKKHILYAPLFRTRHNREFKLSRAVNMGTLPTRFQTLFLTAVIAMNITFCVFDLPWGTRFSEKTADQGILPLLRNRTGTIAVANLVPMFLMVGRNNPLIPLLNVSFDSFNMMHRWFARLCVLEALAHTLCWMIATVQESGWKVVQKSIVGSQMIQTGFVVVVLFVAILVLSPSAIRHAFYETFLHLHIIMAIVAMVFLWMHLDGFPQQSYQLAAMIIWGIERFIRMATMIYRNVGNGGTQAAIEVLPGDALRVSFKLARPWVFKPGQHMYVTIPSAGLWTSHPFSVAWSDVQDPFSRAASPDTDEKGLVIHHQDVLSLSKKAMCVIIRRRTGFTNALYTKAEKAGAFDGAKLILNAMVEGPYGVCNSLNSYGTVLMFAGGVGITHQVPYVRELVAGFGNGTVAARKVTLVWIIQSPEHLEWIRPWMTEILGMEKRRDVLNIKLFITRPRSAKEVHSPSSTVQMFPGRPNIDTLIGAECEHQIGTMGVSVCGTGELQDSVRKCIRQRQKWSNIDFIEESFSW